MTERRHNGTGKGMDADSRLAKHRTSPEGQRPSYQQPTASPFNAKKHLFKAFFHEGVEQLRWKSPVLTWTKRSDIPQPACHSADLWRWCCIKRFTIQYRVFREMCCSLGKFLRNVETALRQQWDDRSTAAAFKSTPGRRPHLCHLCFYLKPYLLKILKSNASAPLRLRSFCRIPHASAHCTERENIAT